MINVKLVLSVLVLQVGGLAGLAGGVELDRKLQKYHEVLLKRPESANLFEKFQSKFLSEHSEKELDTFLKDRANAGEVVDKQVYAAYLIQRGKDDEALDMLSVALEQGESRQVYLDRGRVHARGLAFESALLDLEKALQLGKGDARFELEVNKLIGRYLIRQGSADEAIDHWQKLADANPNDQELLEDLIDILSGDGLYKPALVHAEKLRDSTKDAYKRALRTLRVGDLLQKMGERDKAVGVYNDTLKLSGAGSWLEREILAQIESLYKREDNLIGFKDKLVALSAEYPQRLQISQKLAEVYSDVGMHKESRDLYLSMIKRSPNDQSLRNSLLQALDKAQDYEASKTLVKSMIELSPKDAELHVKLADICHQLKDGDGALESLSAFRSKSVASVANGLRYASLLRKLEFNDEALKAYEELTVSYPDADDVFFVTADFYVVSGKKEEALKLWDKLAGSDKLVTINRLIETLLFQNEKEKALAVVVARKEEFKIKSQFVSLGLNTALANEEAKLSKELAEISLLLADSPVEIDHSIKLLAKTLKQFDQAGDELEAINKREELTVKEMFLKVQLLTINGNEDAANALIAHMSGSSDVATLLQVVSLYEQRYDLDKAATVLEKIIGLPNGLKASYLKQLCMLYKRAGLIDEALVASDRWKKLSPNDKQAWLTHIDLVEIAEGSEAALQQLRRGLERFDGEHDIYAKLAALYAASHKMNQASQLYWRLYDEAEDITRRTQWVTKLADIASKDSTSEELVDQFVARHRNAPESIAPIMALSEVYRVLGREEERRNLMLEAARLRPNDATIFIEIASSDLKSGNRAAAIAALQKAQKVDDSDAASRKLAKLYIEDNDYERGLKELEKVNSKNDGARSTETIVISLIGQDAYDEAHTFLQRKMTEYPNDGRLVLLLALVKYELGFANEGYSTLKRIFAETVSMEGVKDGWETQAHPEDVVIETVKGANLAKQALDALTKANKNYGYRMNYGGGAAPQYMPKDMGALKLMATILLCQILDDVDVKTQEKWIADQHSGGVKHIELYRLVSAAQGRGGFDEVIAHCMKNLDDPFYLALAGSYYTRGGEYMLPENLLNKLNENKESLPEDLRKSLALCVVVGTSKDDYWAHMTKQFEGKEVHDHKDVMLLLNMYSGLRRNTPEASIPKRILTLFEGYLKENPVDSNFNFSQRIGQVSDAEMKMRVSYGVASLLESMVLRSGDYKKIVELLNDRDSFMASSYRNYGGMYGGGYGYRNSRASLKNVDQLFTSMNGLQQQILSEGDAELGKLDFTKIHSESVMITNPLLRYKIALKAEPKKDHSALLEGDIDSEYLADVYLQKAANYYADGDNVKAVEALENVRKATKDKTLRKNLDYLTLECATGLGDEKAFTEWDENLQRSVKSTARRLLLGRLITNSDEIKLIIDKLGMESESSRYLTQSNQSVRQVRRSGGVIGLNLGSALSSSSSSSNSEPWEKAAEQIKKNQAEGAVRTVSNALKTYFRSADKDYYVRKVVQLVKKEKLEEKVLERLSPKDSVSPRKWLIYYEAARSLEQPKEMEKALHFLKNLSVVPSSVRLPLAMALIEENPERAIEMLKQYPDQSQLFNKLGEFIRNRQSAVYDWNNRELKEGKIIDDYIKVLYSINTYLSSLDKKEYLNQSFINFYGHYSNRSYDLKDYYESLGDDALAEYEFKIEEAKRPMHVYALINPGSSEPAFRALHEYYSQNKKLDTLEKELLDAMKLMSEGALDKKNSFSSYSMYMNHGDMEGINAVSRSSFLASLMLESKKPDLVSDELVKSLEGVDDVLVTRLKFYKKHLFVDASKLDAELTKLSESMVVADYLNWAEFIKVKPSVKNSERFYSILMDSLGKQQIEKGATSSHIFRQDLEMLSSDLAGYMSLNKSPEMEAKLAKLLKSLADSVTGKASTEGAKLDAWLDAFYARYRGQKESPNAKIYSSLMTALSRTPKGAIALTKACRESNYPHFFDYISQTNSFRSGGKIYLETADEWLKALRDAKFLGASSEFTVSKLNSFTKQELSQFGGKYPYMAQTLTRYDPSEIVTSDLGVICRTISHYASSEDASMTEKEIIEKLKAIKGKEELAAQVIVLEVSHSLDYYLPQFCKKYRKQIIASPDRFRQSLVTIFDLNNNRKNLSYFKREKIHTSLPLDEALLNKNSGGELKAFFDLTAPLDRSALRDLDETVVDLIQSSNEKDREGAAKILNHFIDLVKGSPDASGVYYTGSIFVSPVQSAWINSVLKPLAQNGLFPKSTLPLVYSVFQREDVSTLNITAAIVNCHDYNWLRNEDIAPTKQERVAKLCSDFAKFYGTVKSEDERRFYRVAWYCYPGKSLYHYHGAKFINPLKKDNKIENEFYDWLIESKQHFKYTASLTKVYTGLRVYANRSIGRRGYDAFFKKVSDYPLVLRMLMANATLNKGMYASLGDVSDELVRFSVDTFVEVVGTMPEYRMSQDIRFILMLAHSFDRLDDEKKKSFSMAAAKCLAEVEGYFKGGGRLHKNQLEDLVIATNFDAEAVRSVAALVDNNPDSFKGMISFVHVFLQHGYVDQAFKILDPSIVMKVETDSVFRTSYSKGMEQNLPAFLAKYTNAGQKATAAAVCLLDDRKVDINNEGRSFMQRATEVIDLARKAEPDFPLDTKLDFVNKQVLMYFTIEEALKSPKYFDQLLEATKAEALSASLKKAVGSRNYKDIQAINRNLDALRIAVRYTIGKGDLSFLDAHLENANQLVSEAAKLSSQEIAYLSLVIKAGTGTIHDMWADGGRDDEVVKLLPIYRRLMLLKSRCRVVRENRTTIVAAKSHLAAEFIHDDLGRGEEWSEFVSKNKLGPEFNDPAKLTPLAVLYGSGLFTEQFTYHIPSDAKKFIFRLLNNKKFQKHVVSVQGRGGLFDYLVDTGLLKTPQAIELLGSGKIQIHEPSLRGIMESDLLRFAALEGRKDDVLKHAKAMQALFVQHPTPNRRTMLRLQLWAVRYLLDAEHKEEARLMIPTELLPEIDAHSKVVYDTIRYRLNLPEINLKGK